MNAVTVSVVMPTYNHARYIGQAIASVLAQTYRGLELIVVDNHSTDGTAERIREFGDERIRYFAFRNQGVIAASRNFGAARATGEFLAFLDSDDVWIPDKLSRQMVWFDSQAVVLIASDAWRLNGGQRPKRASLGARRRPSRDYRYCDLVRIAFPVITSSVVVRRSTFSQAGGFDESPEFICNEDYDLWLRIARIGTVRIIAEPLLYYRAHPDPARDRVEEAQRGLLVIDKHVRLGYLTTGRPQQNARAATYLAMAKLASDSASPADRDYYRRAFACSSVSSVRVIAALGYAASYLPRTLRRRLLDLLEWARDFIHREAGSRWTAAECLPASLEQSHIAKKWTPSPSVTPTGDRPRGVK